MPECLRRTSPICAICKKSNPPPNQVAIDGLSAWLHTRTECEDEFRARLDRGGDPDVPQPALAELAEGEPSAKKPWSTPKVEEVPWDALPTEVRMLVLGLPTEKQPDAVADVGGRDAEIKAQAGCAESEHHVLSAADVVDEAEKAKQGAATEKRPVEPPAQPERPISVPAPVPATEANGLPSRPPGMGDGDWRRLEQRARNLERLRQTDPVAKRLH
jgi:hypothetical protein